MMPIRVLVVDDSAFFRKRLTELLALDAQITVVGTDARGFLERIRTNHHLRDRGIVV